METKKKKKHQRLEKKIPVRNQCQANINSTGENTIYFIYIWIAFDTVIEVDLDCMLKR